MGGLRWLRRSGPGVLSRGPWGGWPDVPAPGARPGPRTLCRLQPSWSRAGARGGGRPYRGREPWYRLDPRLDASGALAGQELSIGYSGCPAATLGLARESFAAGPFGATVLVGSDDGSRADCRCWTCPPAAAGTSPSARGSSAGRR